MSLNIAYNIVGHGDPIFFIHGIGSRKYTWDNIIEKLRDRYQCISYDLRGHGESTNDISNFTLDDLVQDLEKLRSHLHIEKAHLVGHSLGGMIGPAYTRKFPNYVFSLSILSSAAFRTNNDKQKILDVIEKISKQGIDAILPTLITRWFTDDFISKNPKIISNRMEQVRNTDLKTFLRVFWIYATCTMETWLNEIKVPCLVITGENDVGCNPQFNEQIANAIPDSKLVILKNLKHTITLESPVLVGKKIREFLFNLKETI